MPNINHATRTPGELAQEANLKADVSLGVDKEAYPAQVVNLIREEDEISLSKELSLLRKTLKLVCDAVGVKNEDFENYNELVEKAKEEAKQQDQKSENDTSEIIEETAVKSTKKSKKSKK